MNTYTLCIALVFIAMLSSCGKSEERIEVKAHMLQNLPSLKRGASSGIYSNEFDRQSVMPMALASKTTRFANGENGISNELQPRDEKYIIKNARVECRVNDFAASSNELKSIITGLGGYVVSDNETSDNWQKRGTITARIDSRKFDTLITAMCAHAYSVQEKSVSTQDVTEEYMDNETRLRTKRATEEQFITILKQAKSVEDVLNVREKLGTIREEIESMEGRQNYLRNQVAFSTITFTFIQQLPNTGSNLPEDSFPTRVKNSLVSGWMGLINSLLIFVGSWNILVVGAVMYLFYRLFIKKRMKNGIISLRNLIKGNSEPA